MYSNFNISSDESMSDESTEYNAERILNRLREPKEKSIAHLNKNQIKTKSTNDNNMNDKIKNFDGPVNVSKLTLKEKQDKLKEEDVMSQGSTNGDSENELDGLKNTKLDIEEFQCAFQNDIEYARSDTASEYTDPSSDSSYVESSSDDQSKNSNSIKIERLKTNRLPDKNNTFLSQSHHSNGADEESKLHLLGTIGRSRSFAESCRKCCGDFLMENEINLGKPVDETKIEIDEKQFYSSINNLKEANKGHVFTSVFAPNSTSNIKYVDTNKINRVVNAGTNNYYYSSEDLNEEKNNYSDKGEFNNHSHEKRIIQHALQPLRNDCKALIKNSCKMDEHISTKEEPHCPTALKKSKSQIELEELENELEGKKYFGKCDNDYNTENTFSDSSERSDISNHVSSSESLHGHKSQSRNSSDETIKNTRYYSSNSNSEKSLPCVINKAKQVEKNGEDPGLFRKWHDYNSSETDEYKDFVKTPFKLVSNDKEKITNDVKDENEEERRRFLEKRLVNLYEQLINMRKELSEARRRNEEEAAKIELATRQLENARSTSSQASPSLDFLSLNVKHDPGKEERARRQSIATQYQIKLQEIEAQCSEELHKLEGAMEKLEPLNRMISYWPNINLCKISQHSTSCGKKDISMEVTTSIDITPKSHQSIK